LFDEIEKAHPEVFNVLLQILDDGRLTDNQGRTVDFKNTIIIMTSNLGSQYLIGHYDDAKAEVMSLVQQSFKPEFINRIDEIIIFNSLDKETQVKIALKMLSDLNQRLLSQKYHFRFTDKVQAKIIHDAYDPDYGARPLKRYIQHQIESLIAKQIVAGDVTPDTAYTLDVSGDEFIIKKD
jgi:ATP-dependent Clp protease ATP-binding subunit ClpB